MPGAFRALATTALAEAAKVATETILAATTGIPPGVVTAAASTVKSVVDELLKAASQLEKKVDALVGEPLRSALHLLGDAFLHASDTDAARASRDQLLDRSYESFVKASALAEASGEDPLLIEAVALLALALHTGRQSLAAVRVQQMRPLVSLLLDRAMYSETLAKKAGAAALLPFAATGVERPGSSFLQHFVRRNLSGEAKDLQDSANALRKRAAALGALLGLTESILTAEARPPRPAPPNL